jgi:hypothetical protein
MRVLKGIKSSLLFCTNRINVMKPAISYIIYTTVTIVAACMNLNDVEFHNTFLN